MATTVPAGPSEKLWKRKGHRGWLMENCSMEQVIKIFPSSLTKHKLVQFPQKYVWPVYNDAAGAAMLVDAVMDRNLASIDTARVRFPEFDLGLDDYRASLAGKYRRTDTVEIKPLSIVRFGNGLTCRTTLEVNKSAKTADIIATITRGERAIARKILASKKV
jgi:hypothetical protein